MSKLRVEQMDAIKFLKSLPDASVDLFFIDPPYESIEKHRKRGTTTRLKDSKSSSNPWFKPFRNKRLPRLMQLMHRVLKPNRHAYVMCDWETLHVLKPAAEAAGFKVWKAVVWDKMTIGMGYHYRAQHEYILFLEKGKRRLADLGQSDVIRVKRLKGKQYYPAEKPVELVKVFVDQSSEPGETVCDPFMGSGVVGEAAAGSGRAFWGADLHPDAIARSLRRICDAAGSFRGREVVQCALTNCDKAATIQQLDGMPPGWFGVWEPKAQRMLRVCSEDCMRAARKQRGDKVKTKRPARTRKKKPYKTGDSKRSEARA